MGKDEVKQPRPDRPSLCGYNASSMRETVSTSPPATRSRPGVRFLIGLLLAAVLPLPTAGLQAAAAPARPGHAARSQAPGRAEGLLWPLETHGPVLSSFGEYRYDHLHAGVDISTGGGTGFKVLAAAPGEVFRLKVEWRGYGRALYLRHAGGRVTVYGHLERYEDRVLGLEKLVARRQASLGTRYPGDIYL